MEIIRTNYSPSKAFQPYERKMTLEEFADYYNLNLVLTKLSRPGFYDSYSAKLEGVKVEMEGQWWDNPGQAFSELGAIEHYIRRISGKRIQLTVEEWQTEIDVPELKGAEIRSVSESI